MRHADCVHHMSHMACGNCGIAEVRELQGLRAAQGTTGTTWHYGHCSVRYSTRRGPLGPNHHMDHTSPTRTTQRITPRAERETWRGVARVWRFVLSRCAPRLWHGLPHAARGRAWPLTDRTLGPATGLRGGPNCRCPSPSTYPPRWMRRAVGATPVDSKSEATALFSGQTSRRTEPHQTPPIPLVQCWTFPYPGVYMWSTASAQHDRGFAVLRSRRHRPTGWSRGFSGLPPRAFRTGSERSTARHGPGRRP